MKRPIVAEMEIFVGEEWPGQITFDQELANESGEIVFCWKETNHPLPINLAITEEAFEQGRIVRRELKRKINEWLPSSIIKTRISEANSILRMANRNSLKDVEKAYKVWLQETTNDLERSIGREKASTVLTQVALPPSVKSASIQALQFLIEAKIDHLKCL